jgi:hypothetical protein
MLRLPASNSMRAVADVLPSRKSRVNYWIYHWPPEAKVWVGKAQRHGWGVVERRSSY